MRMWIRNKLKTFLPESINRNDPNEITSAVNFLLINLIASSLFFIFSFYYRFRVQLPEVANMCVLSFFLSLTGLAYFLRKGKSDLPANIIMLGSYLVLTFASFKGSGLDGPAIYWILVSIMLGVFILKEQSIVIWYMAYAIGTTIVFFHEELGIDVTPMLRDKTILARTKFIHIEVSMLATLILALIYSRFKATLINQLKDNENQIQNKLDENKNLTRLLSHDIASSLTIMNLVIYQIEKKNGEFDSKQILKMKKALRRAQDVVEQVKQFQAVLDGKMQLTLRPVNVTNLIEYIEEVHRENAMAKNVEIDLKDLQSKQDCYFLADESSLYPSIISNVISNAIKFSSEGGRISVRFDCITEEFKQYTCISIIDQGIGMPEEILSNIFRSDFQTSRIGTKGEKGTGFGMPIVKSFIDMYGGKIEIISRPIQHYPQNSGTIIKLYFQTCHPEKQKQSA